MDDPSLGHNDIVDATTKCLAHDDSIRNAITVILLINSSKTIFISYLSVLENNTYSFFHSQNNKHKSEKFLLQYDLGMERCLGTIFLHTTLGARWSKR